MYCFPRTTIKIATIIFLDRINQTNILCYTIRFQTFQCCPKHFALSINQYRGFPTFYVLEIYLLVAGNLNLVENHVPTFLFIFFKLKWIVSNNSRHAVWLIRGVELGRGYEGE